MIARSILLKLILLLALVGGCRAPGELFSWIDRNCFVADWTNHHSCVSCCCCKNGSCHHPGTPPMPKLSLSEAPSAEPEQQLEW